MTHRVRHVLEIVILLAILLFTVGAVSQEPAVANWPAPPYWMPVASAGDPQPGEKFDAHSARQTLAVPTSPLAFVGITPCRIADTRDGSFPAGYGPPGLVGGGVPRTFIIPAGPCSGIPPGAGAFSLNFTVVAPPGTPPGGYLSVWPTGGAQPIVSTLNFTSNSILANAAVVPAGTSGGINAFVNFSTDLIIDINGYYARQPLVSSLNSMQGDVSLLAGTNISVTPGPQTLTIASTAPALPAGTAGQTLRHSGSSWTANGLLTNTGSAIGIGTTSPNEQLEITGNLRLAQTTLTTGQIKFGPHRFLHGYGATTNTFVGLSAGNFSMTGSTNTGVGYLSLASTSTGINNTGVGNASLQTNSTGHENTAAGAWSLFSNSSGSANTAVGNGSLQSNTTANRNTAVGVSALYSQSFSDSSTPWNSDNTAVGYDALHSNQPTTAANGIQNSALGVGALRDNTTGIGNTAVGHQALLFNTDGQDNVALGSSASASNTHGSWNVAIGSQALQVNQSGTGNIAIGHTAGSAETGSNRLYIGNGLGTLIYGQLDTQRVAIAATDPATTLDVNGSFRVRTLPVIAGGNAVCTGLANAFGLCGASDARLKKNVLPLSEDRDVLGDLARLRGVTFEWNLPAGVVAGRTGRDIGFLAQEVEPVLPEVVSTTPNGYKSIDYPKLTAFLVEVAKAQQHEIEELRARLLILEGGRTVP